MGNRQDDRSSRMGSRNDGRQVGGGGGGPGPEGGGDPRGGRGRGGAAPPERGEPDRTFDRNEDMGGSQWSGASGRGGYVPEASRRGGGQPGQGGYPNQGGYRTESDYDRHNGYGRYAHQGGYGGDREYANVGGIGYAHEGRHEDHDDGSFLSEDSPGHVPNQRWSGGYGADRDREREREGYGPSGPPSGRGFTGNDFGGVPPTRDRAYGAPADRGPRYFGNEVDRGGRMPPSSWNREPQRDGPYRGGGGGGYGFHATDMGMGAPEEERGPHYGKGPKGYKRSDERTREDVCDAIAHQGYVDASDVEVKAEGGIVTLSGTVAHRQDKRKLEHLADQCRGVHEVHNELRLKRSDAAQDKPQSQDKLAKPAETGDGSSNGNKNGKTVRS